jgi:peptidoglycan/LPS O-acetylase OafA/YrhL
LLRHIFYEGYAWVRFVFILSGFILAYSDQERLLSGKMSALMFYKARIARIYPLHLITFVVAAIFLQSFEWDIKYLIKFVSNFTLTQSFFPLKWVYFKFNSPSWSISDEMFFYALFPVIVLCKRKKIFKGLLFSTIILFFLTFLIQGEAYQHALFYISPIVRIVDFCIGICLYRLCVRLSTLDLQVLNNVKWGGGRNIFSITFYLFLLVSILYSHGVQIFFLVLGSHVFTYICFLSVKKRDMFKNLIKQIFCDIRRNKFRILSVSSAHRTAVFRLHLKNSGRHILSVSFCHSTDSNDNRQLFILQILWDAL